jgi:hypothetical protein
MADSEHRMWSYWRDDKGLMPALEDYYPELIKTDPTIGFLYQQAKAALTQLDMRMSQLAEKDDENYEQLERNEHEEVITS